MLIGPRIQRNRVKQSPFSHGVAESTDQQVESSGKVCVKNVTERRGCGRDMVSLKNIARRHVCISKLAALEKLPVYYCHLNSI